MAGNARPSSSHEREDTEEQPLLNRGVEAPPSQQDEARTGPSTSGAAAVAAHLFGLGKRGYAALTTRDNSDSAPEPAVAAAAAAAPSQQQQQPPKASTSGPLRPAPSGDAPVCRICLEEDDASALVAPCHCAGTQAWVHPRCIQRWADEKHDVRCEVCGSEYKPSIVAAPPPRPAAAAPRALSAEEERALNALVARMMVARGGGALAELEGGSAAAARRRLRLLEVYDMGARHDDYMEERHGTASWSATIATFLLFMLLVHSSLDAPAADDGAGAAGDPGAAGLPGAGPGAGLGPDGAGPPGGDPGAGALGAGLAVGLALFGLWALLKLMMISIPLLALWRGLNQAEEDAEAGGAEGRADGSGDTGSEGAADTQRQYPFLVALHSLQQHQWRQQPAREAQESGGEASAAPGGARLVGIV